MAEASGHDEQVENFVGAEIFVSGVEQREFQGVNDSADGVNNSSGQQPAKTCAGERMDNPGEGEYADPAHGDIKQGGEPFGTGNPAGFNQDSGSSDSPDQGEQAPAGFITQDNHADRGVGSGNQNENHHMVKLAQFFIDLRRDIQSMVNGAGSIEKNHAGNENGKCSHMDGAGFPGRFKQQRRSGKSRGKHCDKMGNGTSGVFNMDVHQCSSFFVLLRVLRRT